jgi:hypothetical protein
MFLQIFVLILFPHHIHVCRKTRFDPFFMHHSVAFPMMKKENKYAEKFFQKVLRGADSEP